MNMYKKAIKPSTDGNQSSVVKVKPLSINEAYTGRRKKTQKYKKYCYDLMIILPAQSVPKFGHLKITYEFGVSNNNSDVDNMVKPFQDQLQAKYGFNDNRVKQFTAMKKKVAKGDEYIKYRIEVCND